VKLLLLVFLSAAKILEPTPSPEPDETVLISKKWPYAPFFNAVKRAVKEKWHPPAQQTKPVVLRITLDRKGAFVKWRLLSSSGNADVDQAAIDAFQRAQPFPSPPPGILDKDGTANSTSRSVASR
jgi:TonB family protein